MRFNRVLLISPPSSSYLGAARPPQNLGYLARSLQETGIPYDVLDMRLGYSKHHLFKTLQWYQSDLLGISLVSLEYRKSYSLIRWIKERFPHLRVVAGGPHVTVLKSKVLEECPEIDFGVIHEGEETLVELCKGAPLKSIGGLIYRDADGNCVNPARRLNPDLDAIPFPTYEKFELNKYIHEIPLNSSRGCPLQCIFCPNKMISSRFRWRSAAHVADEIGYWYGRGYRVFNFDDDNFTFLDQRVYELCDELELRGLTDAEYRCSNGLRADKVDEPILRRMKEVGFHYIAFGIDGGNDKMLKANKKGESLEQIEKAVATACRLKYDVKVFCIFGMPKETWEDVMDSFMFVQKYPIKRVILNNPIPYPGTELFEIVQENGWFIKPPDIYLNTITENENKPVFTTPELDYRDRIRLLKKARKIEKSVTRRAVQGLYPQWGILANMAGSVFATELIQKCFFQNKYFRRRMEALRHRKMLENRFQTDRGGS